MFQLSPTVRNCEKLCGSGLHLYTSWYILDSQFIYASSDSLSAINPRLSFEIGGFLYRSWHCKIYRATMIIGFNRSELFSFSYLIPEPGLGAWGRRAKFALLGGCFI